MSTFNHITSALFDVLLAPLGHGPWLFDLLLWSVLSGVVALLVYKYVSNQKGIEHAQDRIKMHLYEITLWRHDIRITFSAMGNILKNNAVYLGHNLRPMAVMLVPFMVVLIQLEANYSKAPAAVGDVELLEVTLDPATSTSPLDVALAVPDGISIDAGPVRTADGEIFWRLRADAPGDHALTLSTPDEQLVKTWAVGGEARKVPQMRTTYAFDALLYPGEAPPPAGSAFADVRIHYPDRALPYIPDGELGVLLFFFIVSLGAGLVFMKPLGVTL